LLEKAELGDATEASASMDLGNAVKRKIDPSDLK